MIEKYANSLTYCQEIRPTNRQTYEEENREGAELIDR